MARKPKLEGDTTRTELIRQYLKDNPTAGPKKVVEVMKAKGIQVSEGLVSQVKYSPSTRIDGPIEDELIAVLQLAKRLGGIKKLSEAVVKLEEVFPDAE